MPMVQHGQLCCPSSILKPSQHAESLEVHDLRTVSFAIEVCTFSQRCVFWSLAEKIGGGIVFWLLWCSFSCCPRCSMSIHFATTGKSDKRRRNNMCGWNTMFGSNIFHMCCAAGASCSSSAVWGFDVDHRTWSKDPTRSMHPIRSSGSHRFGEETHSETKEFGTCKQHANNPFKRFQKHTLQDCSFNSPCFRWLTIKSLSWQLGTSTPNFIDKKIPLSASFFIQVHLLVNYYENITDTEKQKNQTLTFQSLTLVVIGAPQSGTSFYLSAANTFTLLSSFSLCVHCSARGLLLYSACTDGNYSILFDLFITIPQISTIVLSHAPTNINRLAGPGWASFQAILG